MKRFETVFVALFSLTLMAAVSEKEQAIKLEQDKLQGKWKVIRVERRGQLSPAPAGVEIILLINGNKWTIEVHDQSGAKPTVIGQFTFQIDPTQTPKTIDLVDEDRTFKGIDKCIYELDKDTLTVCSPKTARSDNSDKPRPKVFKTADGGTIQAFKRIEP